MPGAFVAAVAPLAVENDQATALTITGRNLGPGLEVLVGGQRLTDVRQDGPNLLVGILRPGLCPGVYPLAVGPSSTGKTTTMDAQGPGNVSLQVRGHRSISIGTPEAVPSVALTGRSQTLRVPFPPIEVRDTACGTDDWRLDLTVGLAEPSVGRRTLGGRLAVAENGPAQAQSARISFTGQGLITTSLTIPRGSNPQHTVLRLVLELDLPANAYAGRYAASLGATFSDGERPKPARREAPMQIEKAG